MDRGYRHPGRRGLSDVEGPQQGPADQRRLQHLPARGRGGAADGARRGRGGGRGSARSRVGRDRRRLHRGTTWARPRRSRARRLLSGTHGPLQASQAIPVRRGTAEEQLRQGAENRTAGAPRRAAVKLAHWAKGTEMNTNPLQGKRALVTGSVQGIGLAMAKALARDGVTVVLHGLPDAQAHDLARRSIAEISSAPVSS